MHAEILEGNAADSEFMALKSSKLLQDTRFKLRQLHLAYSTEKSYVRWIERYLVYHKLGNNRWMHPIELGSNGVAMRKGFRVRRRKPEKGSE